MRSKEIPPTEWQQFAEVFSQECRDRRVSLFAERRSGAHQPIARDVIFRSLAVDTEVGQQSVVVTVDTNGDRHLSHTISKPVSIIIDETRVRVMSELGTGFTIELTTKEASMNPLNDSLRDWGFDAAVFEAKAKKSMENARGDLSEITGVLRETLAKTKQTLLDLQKTREPIADELKNGFERAWDEIEQAFARARKRMRETPEDSATRDLGKEWLG